MSLLATVNDLAVLIENNENQVGYDMRHYKYEQSSLQNSLVDKHSELYKHGRVRIICRVSISTTSWSFM